jgi:hypothetical protein
MCHLGQLNDQLNEEDSMAGQSLPATMVEGHVEFGLLIISIP